MSRKKLLKSKNLKNFTPVTIGDRVNYIVAFKNLTGVKFCELMDISTGNLTGLINDSSKPSAGLLSRILEIFQININWVLTGEGDMIRKPEKKDCIGENVALYNKVETDEDPEIIDLLSRTIEILKSDTDYSASLAANIRSFHQAIRTEQLVNSLVPRVGALEAQLKKSKKIRKEDPPGKKEEFIKRRAM